MSCLGLPGKGASEEVDEAFYNFEEKHIVFQYPPGTIRMAIGDSLVEATFINSREYVGYTV